jgi:hypothetical protein
MAFDLGIGFYIFTDQQSDENEQVTLDRNHLINTLYDPLHPEQGSRYDHIPNRAAYEASQWNYENAVYLSGLLSSDAGNNQRRALRDFLSLYTAIRRDDVAGNGSWEELTIRNGVAENHNDVRAALFGSGQSANALISNVIIGGTPNAINPANRNNPYRNINDILQQLNITSSWGNPHHNHFHIYLQPPTLVPITGTAHLLAGVPAVNTAEVGIMQEANVAALLRALQSLMEMEEIMFTIDVPYVPVEEAPIVLAQATAQNQQPQPDYILRSCTETMHEDEPSAISIVSPGGVVADYIMGLRKKGLNLSDFKPTLLIGPQHGTLKEIVLQHGTLKEIVVHDKTWFVPSHDDYLSYVYDPNPGFLGKDSATFMVEFEGKYYKVEIEIQVQTNIDGKENPDCNFYPKVIKVRKPSSGDAGDSTWDLSESVSFSDLPGAAARVGRMSEALSAEWPVVNAHTAEGHRKHLLPACSSVCFATRTRYTGWFLSFVSLFRPTVCFFSSTQKMKD